MTTALVLTGGGARGAYQAGVLRELLPWLDARGRRPTILCGASVGALNAAALVANAHRPVEEGVGALTQAWGDLRKKDVLRPFLSQVPAILGRYLTELTPIKGDRLRGFIDTDPLRSTLQRWIDWDDVAANTAPDGPAATLMVTATHVVSGAATAFVAGAVPDDPDPALRYVPTRLQVEHLVASAAMPLLFEAEHVPVPADVAGWYCDGSTRLTRPVEPAVAAGADDVVVVSCNSLRRTREVDRDDLGEPDLGDVLVNVLEALMTDVLIEDLADVGADVSCIVFAPEDQSVLASIAGEVLDENHSGPTALLRSDFPLVDWALGGDSPRQAELLSYLLFDPDFVGRAMATGAQDARDTLAGLD